MSMGTVMEHQKDNCYIFFNETNQQIQKFNSNSLQVELGINHDEYSHGGVTLHHACHARAQNMGIKSRDMLKFIPNIKFYIIGNINKFFIFRRYIYNIFSFCIH